MIIKRYLVTNMNEAMTRIRYELGMDAVIISQRKVRKPGVSGFFSKKIIEVTAAVDNSKEEKEKLVAEKEDIQNSINALKKMIQDQPTEKIEEEKIDPEVKKVDQEKEKAEEKSQEKPEEKPLVQDKLLEEFAEIKSMLTEITEKKTKSAAGRKSKLQQALEAADVNEKNIKKILTNVKNNKEEIDDKDKLRTAIKKYVTTSKVKMEGIVVLVGPTGVGKTTTIAKLAGRLSLIEKKKVGLITVDTYRIGAVEQLRTYADIMSIPFEVVITLKDMDSAIETMKDCDVILVDTTGRSSKNSMQLSELRAFVDRTKSKNINLVLSCTTKDKDIECITEGFKELNYNNVIITKLDETTTYGSILNILDSAKKPLNYVTTGQNVPEDIKRLSADDVCKLVLGEETI